MRVTHEVTPNQDLEHAGIKDLYQNGKNQLTATAQALQQKQQQAAAQRQAEKQKQAAADLRTAKLRITSLVNNCNQVAQRGSRYTGADFTMTKSHVNLLRPYVTQLIKDFNEVDRLIK